MDSRLQAFSEWLHRRCDREGFCRPVSVVYGPDGEAILAYWSIPDGSKSQTTSQMWDAVSVASVIE